MVAPLVIAGVVMTPEAIASLGALLGIGAVLSTPQGQQATQQAAQDAVNALGNAVSKAKEKLSSQTATCTTGTCPCERSIVISRALSPLAAQHILDAQARGYPKVLTYEPTGADARRRASTRGTPTMAGMDRDEYPPAMSAEGGAGASIRHIPSSDNRSAGGQMAAQLGGATPGCKLTMTVGP